MLPKLLEKAKSTQQFPYLVFSSNSKYLEQKLIFELSGSLDHRGIFISLLKNLLDSGEKVIFFCQKSEFGVYDKLARKIGLNLETSIRTKALLWVSVDFERNSSLFGSLPLTDEASQLWPSSRGVKIQDNDSLKKGFEAFFETNELASKSPKKSRELCKKNRKRDSSF